MKRILALSLTAALLLAMLGGCTADNPESTVNSPEPTAGASAAVSPTDNTQEPSLGLPSEEPTAEPSAEPSQEPASTHHPEESHHVEPTHHPEESHHPEPTQAPSTQAPATQAPATNPPATNPPATNPPATSPPATNPPATNPPESDPPESNSPGFPGFPVLPGGGIGGIGGLGGGGTTPPSSGGEILEPTDPDASELVGFLKSLFDTYAFPNPDPITDTTTINLFFPGLAGIPAAQRVVCTPAIGFNTAEIALVQVTNSSDLAKAESIFEARKQAILLQQANYLQVVDIWTDNFRIEKQGNYIMMIVHSSCDDIAADFHAAFK